MNILKLGEKENIKLNNLDGFFEDKGISDVSSKEIKAQLEHLAKENYLSEKSDNEYELTGEGKKELAESKNSNQKVLN